jgi:hypothetical protein
MGVLHLLSQCGMHRLAPNAAPTAVASAAILRCAMFRLPVSVSSEVDPDRETAGAAS